MKTIIEPFRIKMVDPIRMTTRAERAKYLEGAGHNLFALKAVDVMIDLLTDSGTGAMSAQQWAGMMEGDESYAGARSFFRFRDVFQNLTGYRHIIPVHQGRAAEKILFAVTLEKGEIVVNNTHFDTTRANVEYQGGVAVDLVTAEARNFGSEYPFKGNMDLAKFQSFVSENRQKIALAMVTVTNNSWGGQPVSLENMRGVSKICREARLPLILDACRFAENAYFIKTREKGQEGRVIREIAQEMFSLADGCTFSAKKDGMANIGGLLALQDDAWAQEARNLLILTEGFPTYGGLAGRDLEAIAQGVEEAMEEDYLRYRIASIAYLGNHLSEIGVPIVRPPGGHAIFIDAKGFLPQIPAEDFPAQALGCELYLAGGVRGVEIGTLMFGKTDPKTKRQTPAAQELLRLAIPRRTYTQSHIDYVIEVITDVFRRRDSIRGLRLLQEAPTLRHFSARLEPL